MTYSSVLGHIFLQLFCKSACLLNLLCAETVNVTIQEQFTFEWKENFGELEVPEMHFLKIQIPEKAAKLSPNDDSKAVSFSEMDIQILTSLEEDLLATAQNVVPVTQANGE